MVQNIGAITIRGNHDEVALERFQSWKSTGTLDVSWRICFQYAAVFIGVQCCSSCCWAFCILMLGLCLL